MKHSFESLHFLVKLGLKIIAPFLKYLNLLKGCGEPNHESKDEEGPHRIRPPAYHWILGVPAHIKRRNQSDRRGDKTRTTR